MKPQTDPEKHIQAGRIPALREIIEERKDKAVENLSASYAKNRLPLEEYERLVEYINKIESERELAVVEKIVAEYDGDNSGLAGAARYTAKEPVNYEEDETDYYPQRGINPLGNMAILSTRNFSGPLKSGAQFVSLLGSGRIEVRKADLSRRQTVINMVTILGDCVIKVESGIRVINNAIPVLGNCGINQKVNQMTEDGDPEIIITGTVLLGDITVKPLKD
jgi:hypothetical protein